MLVAKRDPFHPGAHDNSHSDFDIGPRPARAPRLARTMSALQMVGTLLAVPLGIGSAYTMYRANFSAESTCQSLRASIVSMLDKNVDAHTRHLLARHDVETFEKSCASVDPDATAAFKALLAADAKPAPAHAEAKPAAVKQPEEKPKELVRKAEPAPVLRKSMAAETKAEVKSEARSEAKPETKSETKSEAKADKPKARAARGHGFRYGLACCRSRRAGDERDRGKAGQGRTRCTGRDWCTAAPLVIAPAAPWPPRPR